MADRTEARTVPPASPAGKPAATHTSARGAPFPSDALRATQTATMLLDLAVRPGGFPGGTLPPSTAIDAARAAGLDGVLFAAVGTFAPARELPRGDATFTVLFGVELATDHGDLLAILPDPATQPEPATWLPAPGRSGLPPAREVIEAIRARGGAAIALHPFDRDLPRPMGDHLFTLQQLDGVQVWSGRHRTAVNELAVEAAQHLPVAYVAGSGATDDAAAIGRAATILREAPADEAALVAALRARATHVAVLGEPPKLFGDAGKPRDDRPVREGADRDRDRDRDRERPRRGERPSEPTRVAAAPESAPRGDAGPDDAARKRRRRRGGRGRKPGGGDA